MKTLFALLVASFFVISVGCSGSPTGPSSGRPATPVQPPTTSPAPKKSGLTISPSSVTMVVGQTMVFTASGGDGQTYTFDAGPSGVLDWQQTSYNSVRVTLMTKGGVSSGWVNVTGYDGGFVEETITVNFGG